MKVQNPPKPRPVMLYDGECSFCRRVAFYLRGVTRQQVDFADYHKAAIRFPQIDPIYYRTEVKLIVPSGFVYGGAEAVLKALTYGGMWGWMWTMYEILPPFRWIAEMLYRHVEKNRSRYAREVGPFWTDWDSGGTPYEIDKSRRRASTPSSR